MASVEDLTALLKQARYPGAQQAAQQMAVRLQQPCLQADSVTTRTKARLMLALLDQLEPLMKQIADYDVVEHPQTDCLHVSLLTRLPVAMNIG